MVLPLEADSAQKYQASPALVYHSTAADRRSWGLAAESEIGKNIPFLRPIDHRQNDIRNSLSTRDIPATNLFRSTENKPTPSLWSLVPYAIPLTVMGLGAFDVTRGVITKNPRLRIRGASEFGAGVGLACAFTTPGIVETAPATAIATETPRPAPTEFLPTISQQEVIEELGLWMKPGVIPGFAPKDVMNADLQNTPDGKIGYYYDNGGLSVIGSTGENYGQLEFGYVEGEWDGIPDRKFITFGKDDLGVFSWQIEKTGALDGSRSSGVIRDAQGREIGSAIIYDISDAEKRFYTVTLFGDSPKGNVTYDLYPYGDVSRPFAALDGFIPALPVVDATKTPDAFATTTATPTPEPTATMTATPEVGYPVFDKPEDILKYKELPVVPEEVAYSGKFGETVMRMYNEGKIRPISATAKPYPLLWGNLTIDKWGFGTPINMKMSSDDYRFFQENHPYSFTLARTNMWGEDQVLVGLVWENQDRSQVPISFTIPFSWITQWPDAVVGRLKSVVPSTFEFRSQADCQTITALTPEYCAWHLSIQPDWLALVKQGVESGIMPQELSRYPVALMGNPPVIITDAQP